MPKERHRGPDPEDERAFNERGSLLLREAIHDLCWLLDHGYPLASASELVGNRYKLGVRQRLALNRCACATEETRIRALRQMTSDQLRDQELWIDGFNVLTAIEAALGGAYLFIGIDGCCRDVAGIHRRYTKVAETVPALQLAGACLSDWGVSQTTWFLDSPIANSGRLKTILTQVAARHGWNWQVELVLNPDRVLSQTERIVATADRGILDRCQCWFNLARAIIVSRIPQARLLNFSMQC